jgi:hypothetical protein
MRRKEEDLMLGLASTFGLVMIAGAALAAGKPKGPSGPKASHAPKLKEPADLVATQYPTTAGGDEEPACAVGYHYGKDGVHGGMTVVTTDDPGLKPLNMGVDFKTATGVGYASRLDVMGLLCEDRGFDLIFNGGTLKLPGADRATWLVGDLGQDHCGDTTAVALAQRGDGSVIVALPAAAVTDAAYANTCAKLPTSNDEECAARVRCVQRHFGADAGRALAETKLGEAFGALKF